MAMLSWMEWKSRENPATKTKLRHP